MKNIQVIDGAINCEYSICAVKEADYSLIFPSPGQSVEFVEDIVKRLGARRTGRLVLRATCDRIDKRNVQGIHGTLFFGLLVKKPWYPNKQDGDIRKIRKLPRISKLSRMSSKERLAKAQAIISQAGEIKEKVSETNAIKISPRRGV